MLHRCSVVRSPHGEARSFAPPPRSRFALLATLTRHLKGTIDPRKGEHITHLQYFLMHLTHIARSCLQSNYQLSYLRSCLKYSLSKRSVGSKRSL